MIGDMADDIVLPQIKIVRAEGNSASFEIGPILAGFSVPFANGLRRVLLSSLPGAAITSVRIEGVQHEFQDIPNVKEDVTDIVQNLKRVRLRSFEERTVHIHLDVQREGVVTAADIMGPSTIDIVNPWTHIATLDHEKASLFIEMTADVGRGFVEAGRQVQNDEAHPIGVILVDAIYSPVTHVNFTIEHMSVGELVGLHKIVLDITTDGAVSPSEALRQAADILIQQFSVFRYYTPDSLAPPEEDTVLSNIPIPLSIYTLPIGEIRLPPRVVNSLKRYGMRLVGEILEKDDKELLSMRNIGLKALQEIYDCLRVKGLLPRLPELW